MNSNLLTSPPPSAAAAANATANEWGPFSDAGDFWTSMVITVAGLFCGVLFSLSITAAIYLLFRRTRCLEREGDRASSSPSSGEDDVEKQASKVVELTEAAPVLMFSTIMTRLAGAAAECAICLTEFADGDAVRVLPACNHGFHEGCIGRWLEERGSCPTCRSCCQVVADKGEEIPASA